MALHEEYAQDINASLAEKVHTIVVVKGGINAVYTDGINSEVLKEGKVSLACG